MLEVYYNSRHNNGLKYECMSGNSFDVLKDLQKLYKNRTFFDLNLKAAVYLLVSEYFEKIANEFSESSITNKKLESITLVQNYLLKNIDGHFPGIEILAQHSNMSGSAFKKSFKKITGVTPLSFFIENKLFKAKKLLDQSELNIAEISNSLSFCNNSYFTLLFKKKFGILPKNYIRQL